MKKFRFRRTFFLISLVVVILMTSSPAFAVSSETFGEIELYNEYEYIKLIENSSDSELQGMGVSTQEADKIIEDFKEGLVARASLSVPELTALGYTQDEIDLLYEFRDGETLSDAELRAVTGTCTGKFQRNYVLGSQAQFGYIWTWDHCPIITLSDASAMRWIAYDVSGKEIGVNVTGKYLKVNYYYKGIGTSNIFEFTGPGSEQSGLDFNSVNMQFSVIQFKANPNGTTLECYAKSGSVTVNVEVPQGVKTQIHHIMVAGLYGHTTVGIGSPSISVAPHSIGISFTGNLQIDQIAGRKATIYKDNAQIQYW